MHVRNIIGSACHFLVGGIHADIEHNNIREFPDTSQCRASICKYVVNGSLEFVDGAGIRLPPPDWYKVWWAEIKVALPVLVVKAEPDLRYQVRKPPAVDASPPAASASPAIKVEEAPKLKPIKMASKRPVIRRK